MSFFVVHRCVMVQLDWFRALTASDFPPWSCPSWFRNPLGEHTHFCCGSIFLCFVMLCGANISVFASHVSTNHVWHHDIPIFVGKPSFLIVKPHIFLLKCSWQHPLFTPARIFRWSPTDTKVTHHLRTCRSWCNTVNLGPVTGRSNLAATIEAQQKSSRVSQYLPVVIFIRDDTATEWVSLGATSHQSV